MRARKLLVATVLSGVIFASTIPTTAGAESIEFWTHTYGDQIKWKSAITDLAEEFEAESGIEVNHEILPWKASRKTWLTIAQGGAHPDCADMYWLHSFSAIGGDKFGPMPINERREKFATLEQGFYSGALQDVFWKDDFYGFPWRGDIRAILFRTEAMEEDGLTKAPETWDEVVDAAKNLTKRDANGDVERWGFSFGTSNVVSWLLPLYWQAGGDIMTEDGKTATIDNEAMRAALTYMHDIVNVHKVANPETFEKGYKFLPPFGSGRIAMSGSAEQSWGKRLDRDNPEIDEKWAMAPSAMGPEGRDSFSGAGYIGVLRGSENVEQRISWMQFLGKDPSMQKLSESSGTVGTKPAVTQSEFWSDRPWKKVVAVALEDAHTSQHPAPAWSAISTSDPGGTFMTWSIPL